MGVITLSAAALALLGLLACLSALRRILRRRLVSGALRGTGGATLLAVGGLLGALALNLQTYARLTFEQPVAEVFVHQSGEQRYQAVVYFAAGGGRQMFDLRGDEWQIDARILRWSGWAAVLGLDTRYRLERLSGRYGDIDQANREPATVYALASDRGLDLWSVARRWRDWAPVVDAVYGTAAYVPLADQSQWVVTIGRDGLIVRPANAAADAALADW